MIYKLIDTENHTIQDIFYLIFLNNILLNLPPVYNYPLRHD